MGEKKQCRKCLKIKSINSFAMSGIYRRHECNKCKNERDKEYQVEWKKTHKETITMAKKNWYKKHPNYASIKSREYRLKYPEKWNLINRIERHKRRALGKIDIESYIDKVKILGNKCQICLKSGTEIKLTIDHIIPVSRGGTNDLINLQPLCLPCNKSKFTH